MENFFYLPGQLKSRGMDDSGMSKALVEATSGRALGDMIRYWDLCEDFLEGVNWF